MELGLFLQSLHPGERPYASMLQNDIDMALAADRAGFDEVWASEHFASDAYAITNGQMFLAHIAGHTKNMRLCTGVTIMPYHHPVRLASEIAMLDHMCDGRLIIGIGDGGIQCDQEVFGLTNGAERAARMAETAQLVKALWAQDGPIDLKGQFHHLKLQDRYDPEHGLGRLPKPRQENGPQFAFAVTGPQSKSAAIAGANGMAFLSAHFVPKSTLRQHWVRYEMGAMQAGKKPDPKHWRVARCIHVAQTTAEARDYVMDPEGGVHRYFAYVLKQMRHFWSAQTVQARPLGRG